MIKSLAEIYFNQFGIILKTQDQISGIRKACRLAAHILAEVCRKAKAGVTTDALNDFAHKLHLEAGARPAPLGFGDPPFPKSICTSLNDVICHGIPNQTPLKEGDIISIDVSLELNGFYGDCCNTVMIGNVSEEKKRVTEVSYECLMESIAPLKPGVLLSEIGAIIEKIAKKSQFTTVKDFVGHGIGIEFREPPSVPHFVNSLRIPLAPGMTFTIEPMINAGLAGVKVDKDGWTARTLDGKPSAQWEHMILITDTGHEILTQ